MSIDDVADLTPRVQYVAAVSQTEFDYPFPIFEDDDLVVDVDGVTLGLDTDYTVSGAGNDTGGVVELDSPLSGGEIVTIYRSTTIERVVDFQQNGPMASSDINDDFDKLYIIAQELRAAVNRGLRLPMTADVSNDDLQIDPASWANMYMSFDTNGKPTPAVLSATTMTQGIIGTLLYRRTDAERAAGVVPTNYYVPSHEAIGKLNLRRYGGAPGTSNDNTAAMDSAEAVCAQLRGGTILLDSAGEWRMNWICTTNGVVLEGPNGGAGEFDLACVRPYSLLSAPVTFGDGVVDLRYCGIANVHISGTSDVGGVHYNQSAFSAPHALKLYGVISFRGHNCVLYNGLHTIHIEPSLTVPATDVRLDNFKARNDIDDNDNARLIYAVRFSESQGGGYYTDVLFVGFKGNGPRSGYFAEFDGTAVGLQARFHGGYVDIHPGRGVLLKGGAGLYTSEGFDLDPGPNPDPLINGENVIVETDQAQTDPTRFIFGNLMHGGQRMQFSGTVTDSGTLQSATSTTAQIRAAASFADDQLNGYVIKIKTGPGAGQQRVIKDYTGATDTATVEAWTVLPTSASTYEIYPTILIPAEADNWMYRGRLYRTFMGPTTYFTTANDPYNTSVSLDLPSSALLALSGADWSIASAGKGLRVKEGSNCKQGTATLAAGTVTVSNTSVTANSRIFLSRATLGGTPGHLSYTISAGTSFTITSSSATDTSVINYEIFEPG